MHPFEKGLYKSSLFEYAVSFEAFIEEYLRKSLTSKYDEPVTQYLLKRNRSVEERVNALLSVATGKKLSEKSDVYQAWDENVRKIRNKIFHGDELEVTKDMAFRAHCAVYDAIRFIQEEHRYP